MVSRCPRPAPPPPRAPEVTLASAALRRKPNAFNYVHQLGRLALVGKDGDIMRWSNVRSLTSVFQIGTGEAQAALNLAKRTSKTFVAIVSAAVRKYGMVRGPVTHDALASDAIVLDMPPADLPPTWAAKCKNTDYSLQLLAQRLVGDFEATHPSVRKPATKDDIKSLQRLCCTFAYARDVFKLKVPERIYDEAMGELESKFLARYTDIDLEAAAQLGEDPWTLGNVSDFQAVLRRLQAQVDDEQRQRSKDLLDRANVATFEQLKSDAEHDERVIDTWRERDAKMKVAWDLAVLSYARNRQEKGSQRIAAYLDERLKLELVSSLREAMPAYNKMKKTVSDTKTSISGKTCAHRPPAVGGRLVPVPCGTCA